MPLTYQGSAQTFIDRLVVASQMRARRAGTDYAGTEIKPPCRRRHRQPRAAPKVPICRSRRNCRRVADAPTPTAGRAHRRRTAAAARPTRRRAAARTAAGALHGCAVRATEAETRRRPSTRSNSKLS